MARALVRDEIDPGAIGAAESMVIETLEAEMAEIAESDAFSEAVEEKSVIRYAGRAFDLRTGEFVSGTEQEVAASPVNINHLFDEAGRKIGEGLHRTYWQHRTEGLDAVDEIRLEKVKVAVLLSDPTLLSRVEERAAERVDAWHKSHVDAIENLAEERVDVYDDILGGASEPVEVKVGLGERLLWRRPKGAQPYEKHLFVDSSGEFLEEFKSSWEVDLVEEEIPQAEVVCWFRNRDRQRTSLRVPYEQKGRRLPMYPDFLFLRQVDDKIIVDILDPHDPTRSDAVPKAKGLARYAENHGARFGRIQVIAKVDGAMRRLELNDPKVRKALAVVDSSDALVHLYETSGDTA